MTVFAGARRAGAAPAPAPDHQNMTVAELRALCAERGIEPPKRATKAQLAALLEGGG